MGTLSLTQAQAALEASLAKANEHGSPSSIAVIDDGRELRVRAHGRRPAGQCRHLAGEGLHVAVTRL